MRRPVNWVRALPSRDTVKYPLRVRGQTPLRHTANRPIRYSPCERVQLNDHGSAWAYILDTSDAPRANGDVAGMIRIRRSVVRTPRVCGVDAHAEDLTYEPVTCSPCERGSAWRR